MNKAKQIEAMARLDGYHFIERNLSGKPIYLHDIDRDGMNMSGNETINTPDYLHDHNAVQRVIDGLDLSTLERYVQELEKVTHASVMTVTNMVLATCPQKVEAILKACGKWSDVNDGGVECPEE